MSWGFGNAGGNAGGTNASLASAGPDLEAIETDAIGFRSIAGETKLQILTQQWPSDRLPPSTASLLSVSSSKGLLAAAGPSSLVLATTDAVRQAYTNGTPAENNVKPFDPSITLQIPRVSQVAFSADGSCLVIAAEEGGGLAVYDVDALQKGQQQAALELATNGIPVRALVPNPAPEFAHLFAVILAGGQLLMADLKERKLVSGSQGTYFKEGASCVSWSAKGKQMVAGLEDGTAAQFDHQGNQKASIPSPPSLSSPLPITSIYWLANDDFLTIHTPINGDQTDSTYHLMHRDKGSGSFVAGKFAGDPTPAFGLRNPAHHFISRLKSFPPSLDDMLIISSTAGTDIGVFTCSSTPLSADVSAESVTNKYTTTVMAEDSRRAQMPMSADGMGDTSPIGMCLDLSSKDLVKRPLPSDDMEETATPLPALMVLDHEGRLSTWWITYTASIRQKTAYPGLVNFTSQATPAMQSSAFQSTPSTAASTNSSTPAFGSSTFGQASRPAFGSTSTPGFGSASAMGSKQSAWGASTQGAQPSPVQNKPAFGSATPFGASSNNTAFGGTPAPAAFGSTSGLGNKSSPWAAASSATQAGAPAFGQPSFGAPTSTTSSAGFAKFGSSSASPFGASGGLDASKPSPFAAFGDKKSGDSPFAAFGDTKPANSPFAAFGSGSGNKESPFAAFAQSKQSNDTTQSAFGSGTAFSSNGGNSFGQTSTTVQTGFSFGKPSNLEASAVSIDMMDDDASNQMADDKATAGTSSINPPGLSNFKLVSGFKGDGTAKDDLPPSEGKGTSLFGSGFANMLGDAAKRPSTPSKGEATANTELSATPASPPKQSSSLFNFKAKESERAEAPEDAPLPPDFTLPIKKEDTNIKLSDIPPVPETTPKATKAPKSAEDAPLPPDFLSIKADSRKDDAPLPPDFLSSKSKATKDDDFPPIAGSPPVDLADVSPELSPVASDEDRDIDDEDEDDGSEEDVEGDEEDDEDDGEWEDETGGERSDDDVATPQVTQRNIDKASTTPFGSRLTFPSTTSTAEKPSRSLMPSTTPAGLPKGPVFAPPQKESPRSPSPVRSISTPAARTSTRQVSNQPITLQPRPQANTSAKPASTIRSQKLVPIKPEEPETTDLSDDEDARIRAILDSEIHPTKVLDPFVAHQDYVGIADKPGLGGQIEIVYRDINSMIDTLGLNARSLEAFVRGHQQLRRDKGRASSDLDDEDDWCLVEVQDLGRLEDRIDKSLEQEKLTDITSIISNIIDLMTETVRLRARAHEVRRQVTLQSDPDKRAAQRNAPLDTDTEMKQSQLRQTMSKVQKLLQEAEEQGSILRAELSSSQLSGNDSTEKGPTVEAVTNTIMKMTAMIEQKSGDVDVLEAQIRRLPHGLAGLSLGDADETDPLRSSVSSLRSSAAARRGLPLSRSTNALATPAGLGRHPHRRSLLNGSSAGVEKLGMSGMLGSRFRTPPRPQSSRSLVALGGDTSSPLAESGMLSQSLMSSAADRRRMYDTAVAPEDIRAYHDRTLQRKRVLDALRATVEKKGTRVVVAGQ
ncbi:hypothetical protein ANO11243_068690 [Dothideomycetidae sp. 11243]|nr:hypothetical protein ANO11243_068690 [fungal sp. No.11243]